MPGLEMVENIFFVVQFFYESHVVEFQTMPPGFKNC